MTKFQSRNWLSREPDHSIIIEQILTVSTPSQNAQRKFQWRISDEQLLNSRKLSALACKGNRFLTELNSILYPVLVLDRLTCDAGQLQKTSDTAEDREHRKVYRDFKSDTPNIVTSETKAAPDKGFCLPLYDLDWAIAPSTDSHRITVRLPAKIRSRDCDEVRDLLMDSGIFANYLRWDQRDMFTAELADNTFLVPSTNYWHAYINQATPTDDYLYQLQALEEYNLLDTFWVEEAVRDGYTCLRLPHIKKEKGPFDSPFNVPPEPSEPKWAGYSYRGTPPFQYDNKPVPVNITSSVQDEDDTLPTTSSLYPDPQEYLTDGLG